MEIDITRLVQDCEPSRFSASQAEMGVDAGKITWGNAKDEAAHAPLISTKAELEEFRRWIREFGAWDAEEIAKWNATECNALLIQFISGELRELDMCPSDEDEFGIDWDEARLLSEDGRLSGRIYFYMGRIYFDMES
jgi:hypothetical protein